MTNKLFKELLELKKNNKIDETIFRRVLKLSHKNKGNEVESNMVHVLRTLFSGRFSSLTLNYFLLLCEANLAQLANIFDYEEFLNKISSSNADIDIRVIVISYRLYKKMSNQIGDYLTSNFLLNSYEEASFIASIYEYLYSLDTKGLEYIAKYYQSSALNKQLLENSSMPLNERVELFKILSSKNVLFNDEYIRVIYSRYQTSKEVAIWTAKMLKDNKIYENPLMVRFIIDETNISFMNATTYIVFMSEATTKSEINKLVNYKTPKAKLTLLQKLLAKSYLAKRAHQNVVNTFENIFSSQYEAYLNGTVSEEEMLTKLKEISVLDSQPSRINF